MRIQVLNLQHDGFEVDDQRHYDEHFTAQSSIIFPLSLTQDLQHAQD